MATNWKLERVKANLKALEVARRTGLTTSRLSLIENGWVDPTPVEIEKLKRVLPKLKEAEILVK